MATTLVPLRPQTLAARLRDLGVVSPQQLEQAKQELLKTQERFGAILARLGLLRDADVGKRLSTQLGALPQRLETARQPVAAGGRVPASLWRAHRLIPIGERDGTVIAATDDPLSAFTVEFFGARCGCPIEAVLVRDQDFAALVETIDGTAPAATPVAPPPTTSSRPAAPPTPRPPPAAPVAPPPTPPVKPATPAPPAPVRVEPGGRAAQVGPGAPQAAAAGMTADDEPIVKLVDSMFTEAVRMRSSDIHLQPATDALEIRYRIDGVLRDVNRTPKALQGPVVSRLKIMAGSNIAEKRLPQDGRLQLEVAGRPFDVRVSTLPAMHGESVVMRLLDRGQSIRSLEEMGMPPDDRRVWEELLHRPHGMVLVTGPTGSGKTTTLYGALATLNRPDRKLITVEDPVEYQLTGVNQVAVKSAIGLTFAAALRSMLRQAPDVIMVGEIRDPETAQIAVQAALTGHLVLSTLHTNDAPSAVTRLIDMGVAPFLVASTIQGVLAQRLVRRICADCRVTEDATADEREFLGAPDVSQVIRSTGCRVCHDTGFLGRIGIFEILRVTDTLRRLIVTKPSASKIREQAQQEGMRSLRGDGCAKVREGLTTVAEILRAVVDS